MMTHFPTDETYPTRFGEANVVMPQHAPLLDEHNGRELEEYLRYYKRYLKKCARYVLQEMENNTEFRLRSDNVVAFHIWQEVRAIRERERGPPTIQVAILLPLPIAIPVVPAELSG